MTARSGPDQGPASHAALPSVDPLVEGLLQALPDPALLIGSAGTIVLANASAGGILGVPPAMLRGTRLADYVTESPAEVARYVDACARTRSPLPGALQLRSARAPAFVGLTPVSGTEPIVVGEPPQRPVARRSVSGAAVRLARNGGPALVLLRFRNGEGASSRFALLNHRLDELTREVRARRAAEAALRAANQQLQDQAIELEFANQQLQDQALELEQQIEQAREIARALEQANVELSEAAAEALAARAAAEQANRAKSEFLAVMSHELRTPLNAIGGYAELLELEIRGSLNPAQREDVQRIRRSQRHLLALINQVLNFARIEAGQVRYNVGPVPIEHLVRGLEPLVAPQVRERGQTYGYTISVPTLVARADAEKVEQVLLNLLSNAIKFTPKGGTIAVLADQVSDGARVQVRIRVQDTGVGIPAEMLDHIFEPFVQLDQRLTRPNEGVGLGLAISRDLIRGMGGELTVQSAPGHGSTFTIVLPAED